MDMHEITAYIFQNKLEITAALFGLLYVILASRESFFCWFAGIVNVSIYIVIFSQQKIFANMFLQIVYLVLSFYGLYCWKTAKKGQQAVISKMDSSYRYFLVVLFVLLMGGIYLALIDNSSNQIMLDTMTTAAGIIATWMQARKFIENWLIWIPTDLTIAVMFFMGGLYVSMALYLLYSIIAIFAYFRWKHELKLRTAGI
jgi:nicotinamide mononucleotide transporter